MAAGQNSDRQLVGLCRRKDKNRIGRGLLQSLEQSVESRRRQHVDFVDDIDAVFPLSGGIGHLVDDISDIVDAVVGSRVHFHYIKARVRSDRSA